MRRPAASPLSRPVNVERILRDRGAVVVEASPEECAALAADFGLVGIRDLVGRFRLSGSPARLCVQGAVEALVTQECSVSLEPFEAPLHEAVEVDFTDAGFAAEADADALDRPDPIVNGQIDLGALTAEFLALGLDPYPRKPGVSFEPVGTDDGLKPLAALRKLRRDDG